MWINITLTPTGQWVWVQADHQAYNVHLKLSSTVLDIINVFAWKRSCLNYLLFFALDGWHKSAFAFLVMSHQTDLFDFI